MRNRFLVPLLMVLVLATTANADIIHLKNGNRLEVENVRVVEDLVVFSVFGGEMTIDLSAVERIEKTARPAPADAGIRAAITGNTARSTQTASSAEGQADENAPQGGSDVVQQFINEKLRLQRELRIYDDQIQTTLGTIYAKSAIFADTEQDRARLARFEELKSQIEASLENIMQEAQRAGLNPGQIRQIEDARDTTLVNQEESMTLGEQKDPRDASVSWTTLSEDNDARASRTVLTEQEDQKEKEKEKK